jgi:hypothetical protein
LTYPRSSDHTRNAANREGKARVVPLPFYQLERLRCLLVDSQAHISTFRFNNDREAVISAALEGGAARIIDPSCDLAANWFALALAKAHPGIVFAAVETHPHDATTYNDEVGMYYREMAREPEVAAISEFGLDYFRVLSLREIQRAVFCAHLQLALACHLLCIIHVGDSHDDVIERLTDANPPRVPAEMAATIVLVMESMVVFLSCRRPIRTMKGYKNRISRFWHFCIIKNGRSDAPSSVTFRSKRVSIKNIEDEGWGIWLKKGHSVRSFPCVATLLVLKHVSKDSPNDEKTHHIISLTLLARLFPF